MLSRLSARNFFFALFLFCAGLLGFGLYLQHFEGLEPCPMCIMQRYALALVGAIALLGALHGPRNGGARVYAGLILLVSLAGGGVAARQSWIQLYPPEIPECGPGLEFMVESFGLADALPMIFRGAGDCTAIDWTFLGLSIANWSLVNFTLIALLALYLMVRRHIRRWY
ncbi:disulfide bond formation protein B [Thauera sp. CAU 1555]|uniref:Disulfide bond formation protein B n=1 Tax=Thauera sedimentorum TaxID=2767595 RepID=A0ABR9BDW4_9RHOO|nr:disulfide bond formation protein B [Thauera sedimentorum]MBC9073284.1 disulfide bond formation protein B [Thauera sedimentorum]MBD8504203.1 disulfide bond formation protein B [Thauera sedimentorum]